MADKFFEDWKVSKSAKGIKHSESFGDEGERALFYLLKVFSRNFSGRLHITNSALYVPLQNGGSAEIDEVMVHNTGVYVFESKYFSGSISGKPLDRHWVKSSDTTVSVLNPILQNRKHISALSSYLNLPQRYFISIIVFKDGCDLTNAPKSCDSYVMTHFSDLKSVLMPMLSKEFIFSDEEAELIYSKLIKISDADKRTVREHLKGIDDIKRIHREKKKYKP